MDELQVIILLVNVFGGAAVLGSYVLWLRGTTGRAAALWGGVPSKLRPVYTVSMILSAIGYFAVLYYLLVQAVPAEVKVGGELGFVWFVPIIVLMLFPSALWMPLSTLYVDRPAGATWAAVRVTLAIVGLASVALAWALLTLEPQQEGAAYWAAVVGSCYFAFHTFVLDAIVWAGLFRRQS